MKPERLKQLLDEKVRLFNQPSFIKDDPISIPHRFSRPEDIEISGFFAVVLAWGNRKSIINNCIRLLEWMDHSPYEFVKHHTENELKPFLQFAHRTFNATDLLYFIQVLQHHYQHYPTLEDAFVPGAEYKAGDTGSALIHFHNYFFSLEHPERTRKHIATPARGSACKRLNMYLRWMVRRDASGVDFGIWKKIRSSQLVCPLDVHVARVAHRLKLIPQPQANWKNALLLTGRLRELNAEDPAIYDYALFGMGVGERY